MKITVKQLISSFLKEKLIGKKELFIATHHLQSNLVDYAKNKYDIIHTPETYIRAWRDFKKSTNEFVIEEVELPNKSKENWYRVYAKV